MTMSWGLSLLNFGDVTEALLEEQYKARPRQDVQEISESLLNAANKAGKSCYPE